MAPRIFISAVTREFASTRQRVANILSRLGYEPVWEDLFGSEPGDLRPILRRKLASCQGLIQLAGRAYGSEPPEADPALGRVSYTQFEFLHMRARGCKTWLIFPGEGCSRDTPVDRLDLPPDLAHGDPLGYQAERCGLQETYRRQLRATEQLYHDPASDAELDLVVERLEPELRALNRGFRRWQVTVVALLAVLVLLGAGGLWVNAHLHARQRAAQKVTKERIREHLVTASEQALANALSAADLVAGWKAREQQRETAQQDHALRLERINELAATFAQLEGRANASAVMRELSRVLQEEGVDPALAYIERQRAGVLERVRARMAATQAQNRADLQPLLQAARLHQAKGALAAARSLYEEVLVLDVNWADAKINYAMLLLMLREFTHAEEAFDAISIEDLHEGANQMIWRNRGLFLWWFATSTQPTWSLSDWSQADFSLGRLRQEQESLADWPDLRDYVAEMRAWIGIAAARQSVSPERARAYLEDALTVYADAFTQRDLEALATSGESPLNLGVSGRRILRARTVLDAARGIHNELMEAGGPAARVRAPEFSSWLTR